MSKHKKHNPILPAGIIGLGFLALYALTASPSLGWRDGPEFVVTSGTLGVAHPAGFPTYSMLANLFTWLPIGNIPFRVAFFSAFCAASALFLLYQAITLTARQDRDTPDSIIALAAAATVPAFGLTSTIWENAMEIEVYTLHLLFLGGLLVCALSWSLKRGEAWLYAGAFIFGLAAGNHATVAFFLPGFLAYVIFHARSRLTSRLVLTAIFFLVGLGVYLFLPIRSGVNPTIDFGNPETFQRFLAHITDRKDTAAHFGEVWAGPGFLENIKWFGAVHVPTLFWIFGLPLFLLGLWRIAKSDPALVVAGMLIMGLNILFFLNWRDDASVFLPTYYLAAFFCGLGATWLADKISISFKSFSKASTPVMGAVLTLIFISLAFLRLPSMDQSRNHMSTETFLDDFESLAPDALVVSSVFWFHFRAYQDIYRMRPDLTVINWGDITEPDHFNPMTAERFPRIALPPGTYSDKTGEDYLMRLVAANLDAGRKIYWEPSTLDRVFYKHLAPSREFLFEISPQPIEYLSKETIWAAFERLEKKIKKQSRSEPWPKTMRIDAYYIRFMNFLAEYLRYYRRYEDAITLLQSVETLFGQAGRKTLDGNDFAFHQNVMASSLFELGRMEEALQRMKVASESNPRDLSILSNQGLLNLRAGRLDEARDALGKALAINPNSGLARYLLGELYELTGRPAEAEEEYRRSLEADPNGEAAAAVRKKLEKRTESRSYRSPGGDRDFSGNGK